MFSEKLKKAMQDLNITQAQLAELTGIGKSSISQYLSGKVVPTEERQINIAIELGLPGDYFGTKNSFLDFSNVKIQKLDVKEVARIMGHSQETVRQGIQQHIYPWAYGVLQKSGEWTYFINAKKFAEIERVFD